MLVAQLSELPQCPRSGRSNAAERDSRGAGDLGVGLGAVSKECLQQVPLGGFQLGDKVTQPLCGIHVDDVLLRVDGWIGDSVTVDSDKDEFGSVAEDAEAFASGGGRQPRAQPFRILHSVGVFGQP
ncbi:MAG: hypothetical protein JO272_09825 [Pseudonocardiales bacterium]|nr:hypothetical protein [Pseudonocardiales bacterium]